MLVEPVSLGPSRAAVDLEAAGIHDEAGDRIGREAALQPEAVVLSLVAEDDRDLSAGAALFASLQAAQQGEQALHVAPLTRCAEVFPLGMAWAAKSHADLLSSSVTNTATSGKLVWICSRSSMANSGPRSETGE